MTSRHKKCGLRLGLLLISSAVSGFAHNIEAPSLLNSLESYLQLAQSNNPQLKAFEARYQAAIQRIPQAGSLPDPTLSVTHFVESIQTRTGPQENVFMLSQRLPWLGKLKNRKAVASAEAEALWFAYQTQQLELAKQVSILYYEFGYIGQSIRLTQQNLDLLHDFEPVVEEKVKTGSDLNALLRLKVEIGKLEDKRLSLEQDRLLQNLRINELLALPTATRLPSPLWDTPIPTVLDLQQLNQSISTHNPELQMLKRKIASADARRQIARLESYPDITLGLNYIQTGSPSVNPTTPDAGNDPWSITITVNIPIWMNKTKSLRSEALSEKRAIENEYDNRLNRLQADLSSSLARLADAHRRLALYRDELLGLAKQSVENSRSSYQSGRTGILEVIDSERSLLDLQLLSWRAATDAWQQRILIQTLANQSLSGTPTSIDEHE